MTHHTAKAWCFLCGAPWWREADPWASLMAPLGKCGPSVCISKQACDGRIAIIEREGGPEEAYKRMVENEVGL